MIVVNKQIDIEKVLSPETLLRVEFILDRGDFWNTDTTIVKNQIFKALSGEKSAALALVANGDLNMYYELPVKLQHDKDIVLKVMQNNPEIYKHLSQNLKQDIEIQKNILSSLAQKSGSILELLSIVESNPKNSKTLKVYVANLLEDNNKFFAWDHIGLLLYQVYLDDKKTYDVLFQKWVFSQSKSKITLWMRYIDILLKYQKELKGVSPEEVQQKLFAHLADMLWIPASKISKTCSEILSLLISQIRIVKKQEDKWEDKPDDKDDLGLTDNDEEDDYIPSVWPYSFTPIWDRNTYMVSDNSGNTVEVTELERKSMSEKSLENYINFSIRMKHLGLLFLLEKHKTKIQIATQVNFFEWEWMSPARILNFLNKVGKRLWVPPSSYEDTDGNRAVLCFNDIWAAYFRFREIASSWKIWKYNFQIANLRWTSVVEEFMKQEQEGIIDRNSWYFSITSFQNTQTHQKAV
jgi:hypothetical protein